MEKIDLTKCNNLRVKIHAKYRDYETTGRIVVHDDGSSHIIDDHGGEYIAFIEKDGSLSDGIRDFDIVPRDPETYQDWQVGDRVCDNKHRNASHEVIFRSGELVVMKTDANTACSNYTCDELFDCGYRLVLTDIEQQIIEEKKEKRYEPQDGDICYAKSTSGFYAIFVYNRCGLDRKTDFYVSFDSRGGLFYSGYAIDTRCLEELRPATDEEKQLLFDAMAKQGKRWNAEKKVVEDIPKPHEFKKGEPVLVRTEYGRDWKLRAYVELSSIPDAKFGKYGVTDGRVNLFYRFCLPYNEKTMHLLGTSEDYKEGE